MKGRSSEEYIQCTVDEGNKGIVQRTWLRVIHVHIREGNDKEKKRRRW